MGSEVAIKSIMFFFFIVVVLHSTDNITLVPSQNDYDWWMINVHCKVIAEQMQHSSCTGENTALQ